MRLPTRWIAWLALVFVAAPVAAQVYVFPRYESAAQIESECERLLADQKQAVRSLEQAVPANGALAAVDAMAQRYEDTIGPLALMAAVHPDKAIRDAAEACDLRYQAFNTAFLQNAPVYARLREAKPTDAIDARFQRDLLDQFEDSGIGLPVAQQARVREINEALTKLAQDFERRIREDKRRLPYTAAELAGVPREVWKDAPRDPQGRYLLGLDYPTIGPVLEKAVRPAARERMWRAFLLQGGAENLQTLGELARLRREMASLFGFASYADFALRRRMAENEATVQSFLGEVKQAVRQRELVDLQRLRVAKAQHLKQPIGATVLNR
jgi:thimet oligopeptidase